MDKNKNVWLVVLAVFLSAVLSGALTFCLIRFVGVDAKVSVENLKKAIEQLATQQQAANNAQPTEIQHDSERDASLSQNLIKVSDKDHLRGDKNAPITIVEYSDFECPFCKRFHTTLTQLLNESNGQVNWVFRYFPLSFHDPMATDEAYAAECAFEQKGEEGFWTFADAVFASTKTNGAGVGKDLSQFAGDLGFDKAKFAACLKSDKYKQLVVAQVAGGEKVGVTGTPGSILINNATGEMIAIDGAYDLASLKKAIQDLLTQ